MFPFLTSSTFDTGVSTKGNSMIPKSRRRSSCSFQIHDRTSAALRNGTRPPKLHGPMSICPKVWKFMGLYGYSSFLFVLISFYSVYLPFPGSFDHSRITDRTWMVVKYWPRCWYCISKTFRDGRCQWDGLTILSSFWPLEQKKIDYQWLSFEHHDNSQRFCCLPVWVTISLEDFPNFSATAGLLEIVFQDAFPALIDGIVMKLAGTLRQNSNQIIHTLWLFNIAMV